MGTPREAESQLTRAQIVADWVARLIITNGMKPGDALPAEAVLAKRFNVSRPVVREGLSQLVGLGMIQSRKGNVATVKRLSAKPLEAYFSLSVRQEPQGLRQAIELRRVLEEHVVGVAADQMTDTGVQSLRRCIGYLYVTRDLDAEWAVADTEFHREILRIADNATMGRILDSLQGALWETVSGVRRLHYPADTLASYRRHEAIFDALADRDREAARSAMRAHFDAMRDAIEHLSKELYASPEE